MVLLSASRVAADPLATCISCWMLKMTKAFAYLRVSGKDQISGDGFDRQALAIKAYAAAHDIKIVRTFREEAVSGTIEGMDRPAWVEMIGQVLSNGARTILIEKLDRLARHLTVQEHIIVDMERRGIALISVMEPDLCSDDPTRTLLRQIMGAIGQYDRQMVVLKLRGARTRMKAATGRCEGRKPFGYYDGEVPVLARIRALRDSGLGYDRIAASLNSDGVAARLGGKWHGATVNRILCKGD